MLIATLPRTAGALFFLALVSFAQQNASKHAAPPGPGDFGSPENRAPMGHILVLDVNHPPLTAVQIKRRDLEAAGDKSYRSGQWQNAKNYYVEALKITPKDSRLKKKVARAEAQIKAIEQNVAAAKAEQKRSEEQTSASNSPAPSSPKLVASALIGAAVGSRSGSRPDPR